MSNSCQPETGEFRVNTQLSLHAGETGRETESPLKLRATTDCSPGQQKTLLSEHAKLNVSKNNLNSALSEYSPIINPAVENTLTGDSSEENVSLSFSKIKVFVPEQMARQISPLKAMHNLQANLPDSIRPDCEISAAGCQDAVEAVLAMTLRLVFTGKYRLATGTEFDRTQGVRA
uniref:type VI secretion system contractile sheath small subunit n=1 Tax=Pantoea sp. IMH TaxID=1267600 RepID=UPI0004699EF8|nr:type VI secretion system contractile sheath small subunit [Pantoea sp. IMH]